MPSSLQLVSMIVGCIAAAPPAPSKKPPMIRPPLFHRAPLRPPAVQIPGSVSNIPLPPPPKTSPQPSQQQVEDAIIGTALRTLYVGLDEHFHEGEYNHIVNVTRVVVQGDPRNEDAFANAAYLLWSTDQNPAAVALLKQGVASNHDNYYLLDELAAHYEVQNNNPAEAIRWYLQAVKFTSPWMTWHGLARCYEKTNQLQKALETWEAIAAKYKDDPLAPARVKRLRKRLGLPGGA